MKKMLFICAASLVTAGIASAEVTSANTVGYVKVPEILEETEFGVGMTMWGNNFEAVGLESGKGIPIQELFADQSNFTGADNAADADNLLVWFPEDANYRIYYFGDGWDDEDWDRKWYWTGDDGEPTDHVVAPGVGGWYARKGTAIDNFAFAGQASAKTSYTVNVLADTFTMFANPYPTKFALNDGPVTWNNAIGADNAADADNILIWMPEDANYRIYYFGDGWDDEDWDLKWYWTGDDGEPTDHFMPEGAAARYSRNGGATSFTIFKPF